MKIISHRGWWSGIEPKNSLSAFEASFRGGFGVETDIRDHNGQLIISHDVPEANFKVPMLNDFLDLAASYACDQPKILALNIKSDGLANLLYSSLSSINYKNLDCFVFDMTVPDMRDYLSRDFEVFVRLSEVEKTPAWISRCSGVWLDSFETEWFDVALIGDYLSKNKRVCIVSSELHGRDKSHLWRLIYPLRNEKRLMLCTDYPADADDYFNGGGSSLEN
jgi:glycerophosphoryl diester phosphodiesterase